MISLRDHLYKKMCEKLEFDPNDHDDVVSSDDSYTVLSLEIKRNIFLKKIDLFLRCQEIVERLFNARTSLAKSSINPFIGEFNSLFVSNLNFIPTLFKFAISSVHPVNTDSFFRMVKECWSSSRQIIENGGSLELYLISQKLNKRFCESIYHTHPSGVNSPSNFGFRFVPYHLGQYPIFDPTKMILLGPEYHNYEIFKKHWNDLTSQERTLFINSHKLIDSSIIDIMKDLDLEVGDTMLGGMVRIEAMVGPIKQLERIKRSAPMNIHDIQSKILENPLIIFKKSESIVDVMFKTCQKLYVVGAAEAAKTITSSIYYGRVSASASASVFYINGLDYYSKTYKECVQHLSNLIPMDFTDFEKMMKFIYPRYPDYDLIINKEIKIQSANFRNIFEVQTVRKLVTHKIHSKLTQPIVDLIEYK
jgi:proteasome lid subunit RPN8/RPN11